MEDVSEGISKLSYSLAIFLCENCCRNGSSRRVGDPEVLEFHVFDPVFQAHCLHHIDDIVRREVQMVQLQ